MDYQRILFETAMLVMVCDGDINADEIKEMEIAFEKDVLFGDLDFHEELARMMGEIGDDTQRLVTRYFAKIDNGDLSPVQKLRILEIALRIVYADNRIEPNEIRFVKLLKTRLGVMDEIFFKRFGEVEFLQKNHTPDKTTDTVETFISDLELPDLGITTELGVEN